VLLGYCIRRRADVGPPEGLRGVDAAPVRCIAEGELAVWVSGGAGAPATVEMLHAHDRVVRAALRTATPLPLRFGTRFSDEAEGRKLLRSRADEFLHDLRRLKGQVEMSVRVAFPSPEAPVESSAPAESRPPGATPAAGPGRDFLERRRSDFEREARRRAEEEAAVVAVTAALAHLELPSAASILGRDPVVVGMAHLVHRERLRPYRNQVAELKKKRPDLEITLTGPWAPYSFVR
jgi:hypothetical protein